MSDSVNSPFYMTQLWMKGRRLAHLGDRMGLFAGGRPVGTNYLVHCALGELFGDKAPQPFVVQGGDRELPPDVSQADGQFRVLGYGESDRETLQRAAQLSANPPVYEICDWERCASKPMPTSFQEGQRLQFELRACPVIRKASSGPKWEEGQELDAFLSRAWENPDEELEREQVYREWLIRQFDLRGGAQINPSAITMDRFSIERMTRRTHGDNRSVRVIQRPDVTFTGRFTVTDSDEFVALLRSGIGRHKSFGFGMLKVRPAT